MFKVTFLLQGFCTLVHSLTLITPTMHNYMSREILAFLEEKKVFFLVQDSIPDP